jgi:hypothetical protein
LFDDISSCTYFVRSILERKTLPFAEMGKFTVSIEVKKPLKTVETEIEPPIFS